MTHIFEASLIGHMPGKPRAGTASHNVLSELDFDAAMAEIGTWQGYAPTPLHCLSDLAARLGVRRIDYKHEGERFGLGSFKALGGSYAGLRLLQRELARRTGDMPALADIRHGQYRDECADITLVSATDGNHGRSLAWGCKRFGARCRIYIHAEVSQARAKAMRDLGADVIRIVGDYDASVALAREEAEKNGWLVVSDTSWPGYFEPPRDVMAGYGVMVREICASLDQAPTHVFLQGGVGGLAACVVAALRQHWGSDAPRAVVVEPDRAACLFESARQGRFSTVKITDETIMAGLSCGEPSEMALEILTEEVSDYLTIPDDLVPPTIRLLGDPPGYDPVIEAGESAVAGLAALIAARAQPDLSQKLGLDGSSRILLIGSEGVTDPNIYAAIMENRDEA